VTGYVLVMVPFCQGLLARDMSSGFCANA
jgi:hypothetical protein